MSALSSTPSIPPTVRRRVWPVAAAGAAAAAIALPLVFLQGGHSTPAPSATPPAPAATAPNTAAPAVTARAAPAHVVHAAPRTGPLADPFGRGITAPSTAAAGGNAPTSTSSHATPVIPNQTATSTPSTPTATSTPTVTPSTQTITSPSVTPAPTTVSPTATPHASAPATPWHVYRADVRVSPATGGTLHRHLARLTPLPSAKAPFVVYLGAVHGGHRTAFLLNRLATATGSGRCAAFHGGYEALYLKVGQTERVTIPFLGVPVTYRVGVVHMKGRSASSAHAARVANHRVAPSGTALLRRYRLAGSTRFSGTHGVMPAPKRTHAC